MLRRLDARPALRRPVGRRSAGRRRDRGHYIASGLAQLIRNALAQRIVFGSGMQIDPRRSRGGAAALDRNRRHLPVTLVLDLTQPLHQSGA